MIKVPMIFLTMGIVGIVLQVECKTYPNVQGKPNIVLMLADDLGSNDISLKGGNQILTPNIDALGYQGVILNRHYTSPICTPSRSALLTGKYPIHTGMQHFVLMSDEPRGLPLNEKILPQYLKEVGYKTHMVGKWHQGFARKAFTPTYRGFDSHVGYLGPIIDYFDYTYWMASTKVRGFDFRRNETVYRDRVGEYLTDVVGDEASRIIYDHDPTEGPLFLYFAQIAPHAGNPDNPMQAREEDLNEVRHIKDPKRRAYAAMVRALDRSVGKVVKALKEKDLLENSIILFFSDNGGPTYGLHSTLASNYPLRGQKNGPWEGGTRGTALVWSPLFKHRHYVSNHLAHITDWLPTFAQAVGVTSWKSQDLDGNDIWDTLSSNQPPLRREMVHDIDPIAGYTSYYHDGWKYINGTTWDGEHDNWLGDMSYEDSPEAFFYPELVMRSDVWKALNPFAMKPLKTKDLEEMRRNTKIICRKQISGSSRCDPLQGPCLFYLNADPCEISNLIHLNPSHLKVMEKRLKHFQKSSVPPNNLPSDPNGNPALNDGLWTWWLEDK